MFWVKFTITLAYLSGIALTFPVFLGQVLREARHGMAERYMEYKDEISLEDFNQLADDALHEDRWLYRRHALMFALTWPAHLLATGLLKIIQ